MRAGRVRWSPSEAVERRERGERRGREGGRGGAYEVGDVVSGTDGTRESDGVEAEGPKGCPLEPVESKFGSDGA